MTMQTNFEELDHRESDGIEVSLLWSRADGSLAVAVVDQRTAERFELPVGPGQARDAFQHPFAYAALGGFLPEVPTSELNGGALDHNAAAVR